MLYQLDLLLLGDGPCVCVLFAIFSFELLGGAHSRKLDGQKLRYLRRRLKFELCEVYYSQKNGISARKLGHKRLGLNCGGKGCVVSCRD